MTTSSAFLQAEGIFPIPKSVIRHHGKTIFGPMKEWHTKGRIAPALLLTGTSGIGKRHVAYFIAQWILCERNGFSKNEASEYGGDLFGTAPPIEAGDPLTEPCGECASCQRAIHGSWVDFVEIAPDPETGTLKIEQFRRMKESLGFGAHEGAYRIHLIPNADRMTPQAANSVLKILEEPPRGWLFFLTTNDPSLVLPTVLSRCQVLRLKPFDSATLDELLLGSDVPAQRKAVCLELAQGSWGKATALASDEIWEYRTEFFDFLKSPQSHLNRLIDWTSQDNQAGEQQLSRFALLLDQLEHMLFDLIRWSLEPKDPTRHGWSNLDGAAALASHAQSMTKQLGGPDQARLFWIERAERLARARQESLSPVNRKLLIQDLLMPFLK
ncbi:MAG: hypothetical protein A2428_07595 [Bdellovibrionales bacterium RIFOXYC1_FULL_54_43]|nr:MAG: hypothetical protein A2428_07595 [Bdellovibrionales bacterium RIFOXYC1_FULL_54_43]OFZ84589.1 MAG: hypothetical protein A2603_11930 [Bdellovibrionales bacterium RIFOXYD1_FULL_55_31]